MFLGDIMRVQQDFYEAIGLNVLRLREKHNLSQEEFGKVIDEDGLGVSRIERGIQYLTSYQLYKVCKQFGVSCEYFIEGSHYGKRIEFNDGASIKEATKREDLVPDPSG
jgi:transcriptional regulator with XRE-family HTH domain